MIINPTTIRAEKIRAKHNQSLISCVGNGINFTRLAAELVGAPCKLSFEKRDGIFLLFKDQNGFDLKQLDTSFQINSRPLKLLIERIFEIKRARFKVINTCDKDIFELKLVKDEA